MTESQIETELTEKLPELKYNKALFQEVLSGYLARYAFALPALEAQAAAPQAS